MSLRNVAAVAPVLAVLALAAPVAGASAQTTPDPGSPGSTIPCYPYPAFCGPNGTPWFSSNGQSWFSFPFQFSFPTIPSFGPGPALPGVPVR
jgi:hypothetical protein